MIAYGAATDIGLVRSENQDSYGVFPEEPAEGHYSGERLFVVADGMGGHKGGKRASTLAVEVVGKEYFSDAHKNLVNALQSANQTVHSAASRYATFSGMGTTCVGLVVDGNVVHVAHIGDSRAYRIKSGRIVQITEDHSAVAEMQRRGMLSAEEAERHPERSVLYRALGTKPVAEIDLSPDITVTDMEFFVLCSDGLTTMVQDAEILDIVESKPPQEACDSLIRLANERGGYDNITVIVIQVSAQQKE